MGVGYTSADRPFLSLSETRCESGDSKILDGRVPGQGTKTRGLPEKSHSRLSAQGAPREVELSELVPPMYPEQRRDRGAGWPVLQPTPQPPPTREMRGTGAIWDQRTGLEGHSVAPP